jgi:hypothetical protein
MGVTDVEPESSTTDHSRTDGPGLQVFIYENCKNSTGLFTVRNPYVGAVRV